MNDRLSIIGSGQYNWDIIKLREYPKGFIPGKRNRFTDTVLTEEVGGTCGNVMCMLARFGWLSLPQVKLTDTDEGRILALSLRDYGCDTRYVSMVPGGGFSGLVCTHRKNKETGKHELGLRSFGPNGSRFRKVTELRARDEVPRFLDSVDTTPDVYFFDHDEAGPRKIAEEFRKKGALIYYECENDRDRNRFVRSVGVADIVKFSDESVSDVSFCADYSDKLFIQTQGSKGLRFRLRDGNWIHLDPVVVKEVIDWEGCGDTVTAVFLNELGRTGLPSVSMMTEERLTSILKTAIEKAALCTRFYGSKGWLENESL